MSKKLTNEQIMALAQKNAYEYEALRAVIEVESNGNGFASAGRLTIQFEPSWFKRTASDWRKHEKLLTWVNNGVENQDKEYQAFTSAFQFSPAAAMKSTSIGLMQVMGFHYSLLGFRTVGDMWNFAKQSEANQLELGIRFIQSNKKLDNALKNKDWATFAYYYNGALYRNFKYDTRLATAYKKFKS
jgi:hypothetical protein